MEIFNQENFLLHTSVEDRRWVEIHIDNVQEKFNLPLITKAEFSQLYEVTSSVHSLLKGKSVISQIRNAQVIREEVGNFEDLREMLEENPTDLYISYKRLMYPPPGYRELNARGILPDWPGPGYLLRMDCFPTNRSDAVASNHKLPTIFILDSDLPNPLNCTDKLRRIGAMFCKNCPSLNGGISACRHLGALILVLFAPYVIESTNLPVAIVNIKNKRNFLDPPEIMDQTISSLSMSMSKDRHSVNKRLNNLIYEPERNVPTDSEEDNDDDVEPAEPGSVDEIIFPDCASVSQEFVAVPQSSGAASLRSLPPSQRTSQASQRSSAASNRSQTSSATASQASAGYGHQSANVERYLTRVCRSNPAWTIPQPTNAGIITSLHKRKK